jgi:two-component system NtrC family sensor kinase
LAVELQDSIELQEFSDEKRTEIHDLLDMLQGNLGKIVQHGRRADSIVKNMLLHSRQISGEHRSVDLNALVEESLNLAYHVEITRVLLNLEWSQLRARSDCCDQESRRQRRD